MKPSLQQEEILRTYLNRFLKFHETIDEVYDHILTALEEKFENLNFQETVNQILNDDFGGGNGLVEMEKQHLKTANKEALTQILNYVKAGFKVPNIFSTLLTFLFMFAVSKYVAPKISFIEYIPLITILAIFILLLLKRVLTGYYKKNIKRSIQDIVEGLMLSYFNFGVIYLSMLMPRISKLFKLEPIQQQIFVTSVLTFCFLYLTSIIKLGKAKFKLYNSSQTY